MERLQLRIGITLDEEAVAALVTLLRKAIPEFTVLDEKREARLRASQHALFSGQKPPDDRGLLIDTGRQQNCSRCRSERYGACGTRERCHHLFVWAEQFDGATENSRRGWRQDGQPIGEG